MINFSFFVKSLIKQRALSSFNEPLFSLEYLLLFNWEAIKLYLSVVFLTTLSAGSSFFIHECKESKD